MTEQSIRTMLAGLTLDDVRAWAGPKIYNRGRDYLSLVSQLRRTAEGTLVAWVSGNDDYATSVRSEGQGDFDYDCTCPYEWGPCKHAVAVLLAASEQLKQGEEIPLLDPDDEISLEAFEDAEDVWLDDEDEFAPDLSIGDSPKGRSAQIESLLAGKTRDQLQQLLMDLARDCPEVFRRLRDTARLEGGHVDQLVRSLRKEIRQLTSEDAWYNPWKQEGNLPDYAHLEEQLEALRIAGHADAVIELGAELWDRSLKQVEESDDEGETALAIASCLDEVLRALPDSTLTPPDQLLWRIEHELEDQYGMLDGADDVLTESRYTKEHWSEVAATLDAWLTQLKVPKDGDFSRTYHRERLIGWLRKAYLSSDQAYKILALLEQEADRCRSYDLLVTTLLEAGECERARQWCLRGFKKTIKNAPGIAHGLQERLRALAETQERFDLVAAYRAEDFFDRPSRQTYLDVRQASEPIAVWDTVREHLLDFLESGQRPLAKDQDPPAWPLPALEVQTLNTPARYAMESFPNRSMLIDIALLEGRHADAVAIYQELMQTRRWGRSIDDQLAEAVANSHPDVALQIWQAGAEDLIAQVKPQAYRQAASYLRQMRRLCQQQERLAEWQDLIRRLRAQHKAKRRLLEVLDELEEDRPLID